MNEAFGLSADAHSPLGISSHLQRAALLSVPERCAESRGAQGAATVAGLRLFCESLLPGAWFHGLFCHDGDLIRQRI